MNTRANEAVAEDKQPLDLKPKPPVGKRLNKRLLGLGILALAGVMAITMWGINRRSEANTRDASKAPSGETTEKVQAVPPSEAKTLVSNLQKPVDSMKVTGTAQPGTINQPATLGNSTVNNPASGPSANVVPWYRPQSQMSDSALQRAYQPPNYQTGGGTAQRKETPAEEAARLEHEALYAPMRVKKDDAVSGIAPAALNAQYQNSFQPATPQAIGGANDLEQIAALAKSLIPTAAGQTNATPDLRLPGISTGNATPAPPASGGYADTARRHMDADSLNNLRMTALSPYEIKAGWEIPAMLEQGLKSELPGELRALVTQNVRDTASGKYILIPQGSRLIGTYNEKTTFGQSGVEVIWTRVIFPDASSLNLDGMLGQDQQGYAGLRGKTDNHYGSLVGGALLTSILSATASLANNRGGSGIGYYPSWQQAAGAGAAQSIQETGQQLTQRNLNRRPTITIPVGQRFNVHVNKDIRFDGPYLERKPLLSGG